MTEDPPNIGVKAEGLTGDSLTQQQMYVRCNTNGYANNVVHRVTVDVAAP